MTVGFLHGHIIIVQASHQPNDTHCILSMLPYLQTTATTVWNAEMMIGRNNRDTHAHEPKH